MTFEKSQIRFRLLTMLLGHLGEESSKLDCRLLHNLDNFT